MDRTSQEVYINLTSLQAHPPTYPPKYTVCLPLCVANDRFILYLLFVHFCQEFLSVFRLFYVYM